MERPHRKKTDVLNKKDSSRLTPNASRSFASRGFTLIEIIMVMVLLGIVGSVASMIIFQGSKSYSEEEIRKAAFACLKRIELNKRVRLIGVRASNLKKMAMG